MKPDIFHASYGIETPDLTITSTVSNNNLEQLFMANISAVVKLGLFIFFNYLIFSFLTNSPAIRRWFPAVF